LDGDAKLKHHSPYLNTSMFEKLVLSMLSLVLFTHLLLLFYLKKKKKKKKKKTYSFFFKFLSLFFYPYFFSFKDSYSHPVTLHFLPS